MILTVKTTVERSGYSREHGCEIDYEVELAFRAEVMPCSNDRELVDVVFLDGTSLFQDDLELLSATEAAEEAYWAAVDAAQRPEAAE